jgi:hypothetical protein
MNGAPDGAHNFFVTGMLFELQRFFVEGLDELLRSLIEELPQFQAALVGRIRHAYSLTSIR